MNRRRRSRGQKLVSIILCAGAPITQSICDPNAFGIPFGIRCEKALVASRICQHTGKI